MKIINYNKIKSAAGGREPFATPAGVRVILDEVRERGDVAVKGYTQKFDGVKLDAFRIDKKEFAESLSAMDGETVSALEEAAKNLEVFARRQLEQLRDFRFEIRPGVLTGQRVVPLERVGVYVPGGNFPLVSSLLMGAVPARVAGVKELVVCTPPGPDGRVQPVMLAAAAIAGVDELYTIGGAQAVGAMAYGTETIKRVDKIVGPGNRYVTAAKKEVYGTVGIDFIAGPSEVMVIADDSADPGWIAADLLAQAEHDLLAVAQLVTPSPVLAERVKKEIEKQLAGLSTKEIAAKSIERNGCIVLVETLAQAIDYANIQAPEHLELQVEEPEVYQNKLSSYGTLFIGKYAAEVLGDYSSGLNHTLPTSGAARYTGGLSVRDFVKILTTLQVTEEGIKQIGKEARSIARLEGLSAHAQAVSVRFASGGSPRGLPAGHGLF